MKHGLGLVVAAAAAVLWVVLAARTPSSTFHFAPAIVAAAWVVVAGQTGAGLVPRMTVRLAIAGFVLAAAVTVGLEVTDRLRGPVFWAEGPDAPVVTEHLLFALLGAVGGAMLSIRHAARTTAT